VYKSTFKKATRIKEEMKIKLKNENFSLHFDRKHINKTEYVLLLLKNEQKEAYLDILCLENGRSETMFKAICSVIDEFNLWSSIKMVVCDATAVSTGRKNGVVVKLQNLFESKDLINLSLLGANTIYLIDLETRNRSNI
jgi:hypothetical protein